MTTVFLTETLKCDRGDPSISEAMFFWTMSSVDAARSFKIPSVRIEIIRASRLEHIYVSTGTDRAEAHPKSCSQKLGDPTREHHKLEQATAG